MPWRLDWVSGRLASGFKLGWVDPSEKENNVTQVLVTDDAWDIIAELVRDVGEAVKEDDGKTS